MQDTNLGWLLLVPQLPSKPDYLRVKIWRRLQRIGAVAIKNSVYVLPKRDQTHEDFQWTIREINEVGGEGMLLEAHFVEGFSDEQVTALFHAARDADYAQIAEEAREVSTHAELARLHKRFSDVVAIDFFDAPGRARAAQILEEHESKLSASLEKRAPRIHGDEAPRGRVWVTRKGIHIDRMASAWLIRRFIDTDASFKFVGGKSYSPENGELRFDMYEGEFTHEGEFCTFEVLIRRFGLEDPGLETIAEIVHDIDLKETKFGRGETIGIDRLIAGIAMGHKDDESRLARAAHVFDDLYEYFRRKA